MTKLISSIFSIRLLLLLLLITINLFKPLFASDQETQPSIEQPKNEIIQQININNAKIQYQLLGDGNVIIVFESGFGSDLKVWSNVIKLLPKNIKTLTYSRAEVASTNINVKPRSIGEHVDDLQQLLNKLKINIPIIFVAHSYGGLIAAELANRDPQLLSGIVLVDPATISQRHQFKLLDEKLVDNEDKLLNKVLPSHLKPTYDLLIKQMEHASFHNSPLPKTLPAIILTAVKAHSKPMVISETVKGKKVWLNLHKELISNKEIQIVQSIDSTDHNLHISQPKLIANAISQLKLN